MPRKIDRQREIDQRVGTPVSAGDLINTATPAGPAVPTQSGPTNLAVASNVLMFSAVTPLALIGLTWEPAIGLQAAAHQIEAATNSGFTTGVIRRTVVAGQLSASLELPVGTLYYFRVQAHTQFVVSAWSNTVSTTTATDTSASAVPTALSAVFNNNGDLEISWTNPTTANFRDVEVSIYGDAGFTVLLFRAYDASQRLVWTASQNRQAGGGTPDVSVFVRMASRSWGGVLSSTVVPSTQPVKAVPGNPSGLTQSWSGDAGTAAADLVVSWTAATGASFYRLSIDGVSRDVFGVRFVYNFDQNRVEHSGTPDPVLTLSLIGVDGLDQVSATPATATATNAAPAAPGGITLTAFFSTLSINTTSVLPADGSTYRYRLIQTVPSASDITWDSPSPLQTRAISAAATYQIGIRMVDVFGQQGTETLSSTTVADALTLADLRTETRYSDSQSTSPATLKAALSDDVFTSGSTPTFVGASALSVADTTTTISQTPNASTALNDVMLAHLLVRADSTTLTPPSGWTLVPNTDTVQTAFTPDLAQAIYYRFADSDEASASYTFTSSVSGTMGVVISSYRGVARVNAINASNDQTNASSTTVTAPSIITDMANVLLVFLASTAANVTATVGGSLTERYDTTGGTNRVMAYGATELLSAIGATGTRTATLSGANSNIGVLIALQGASETASAITYTSNAGWARWCRMERDLLDRYRTLTLAMSPASGTSSWYVRTSVDASTWEYFAGPVKLGRVLTPVASSGAAQSAAISSATLGSATLSRVDLPTIVEARYIEVWIQNTAATTTLLEWYPRRIVQADDIEAESLRAIHILVGSLTADRLSVNQLSAITADMGTITAGTITGATIQTASGTGARIELTSANGLRSYNSSNVLQTQIRTTDGFFVTGAGAITMDATGIDIRDSLTSPIQFFDDATNDEIGRIYGSASSVIFSITGRSGVNLELGAINASGTHNLTLGTISAGAALATFSHSVKVTKGLNLGTATGAADGTINVSGGINLGSASGAIAGELRAQYSVNGSGNLSIRNTNTGSSAYGGIYIGNDTDVTSGILRNSNANTAYGGANSLNVFNVASHPMSIVTGNAVRFYISGAGNIGFFGSTGAAKPTVTGSRGGNAALASLLTGLANLGLLTDSSTA